MGTSAARGEDQPRATNILHLAGRRRAGRAGAPHADPNGAASRIGHLLELAGEGYFDWSLESGAVWATPQFYELYGLDRARPIEAAWPAAIHPDDRAAYRAAMRAHFRGDGRRLELRYRVRGRDGACRWVLNRFLTVRRADGRVARVLGSVLDITEDKRREAALAQQSRLLEIILGHIDQGISVMDPELRIVAFNARVVELLDLPAELVRVGVSLENIFRYNAERGEYGPGDTDEQVASRMALARRFEAHRFERTRPDGTVIEIVGNPLPGHGGFVTAYSDITARKTAERRLEALATIDELTGLATRRRFLELAETELGRAARHGRRTSLLFLDLDRFKAINDRHGHGAGDAVLRAVAAAMADILRAEDVAGRIGGEEFAVVMPDTGHEQALVAAERIRARVAALTVTHEGARVRPTVSIGVAEQRPERPALARLMARADGALYRAKKRGRDRVESA